MLQDRLTTMHAWRTAGSEKIRRLNSKEVAQVAAERRLKAQLLRRARGGPAVGALLGDATWVGPPKPKD